jgi:hypothetical protein
MIAHSYRERDNSQPRRDSVTRRDTPRGVSRHVTPVTVTRRDNVTLCHALSRCHAMRPAHNQRRGATPDPRLAEDK